MNLRQFVKAALKFMGIQAWPLASIPRGISLEADLKRIFKPPYSNVLTLFDVGANIGQTMVTLNRFFPASMIYCFEPVASTYRQLMSNCTRFRNVLAYQIALGERTGEGVMAIGRESIWSRIIDADNSLASVDRENVEMCRLDDFCKRQQVEKIDLLKTDCEGYDLQVLRGAENLFRLRAIQVVYCEVNFERNDRHGDFFAIEEFLRRYNFVLYGIYDYSSWQFDVAREGFANALFVSKELCAKAVSN